MITLALAEGHGKREYRHRHISLKCAGGKWGTTKTNELQQWQALSTPSCLPHSFVRWKSLIFHPPPPFCLHIQAVDKAADIDTLFYTLFLIAMRGKLHLNGCHFKCLLNGGGRRKVHLRDGAQKDGLLEKCPRSRHTMRPQMTLAQMEIINKQQNA